MRDILDIVEISDALEEKNMREAEVQKMISKMKKW